MNQKPTILEASHIQRAIFSALGLTSITSLMYLWSKASLTMRLMMVKSVTIPSRFSSFALQ